MKTFCQNQEIAYREKWLAIWLGLFLFLSILTVVFGIAYFIFGNDIFYGVAAFSGSTITLCGYKIHQYNKMLSGLRQRPGEEVIQELLREGKPYAVYLRNFGHEANESAFKAPEVNFTGTTPKRSVEMALKETFGNELPIIGLSNPKEPFLDGIYRIESTAENWLKTIQELIGKSRLVILYLSVLTPNIQSEIDLITSLGFNEFTIVIVSRKLAIEHTKKGEEIRNLLYRFENVLFERQYPWWKVLTRHPDKVSLYRLKKRIKRTIKELNIRGAT